MSHHRQRLLFVKGGKKKEIKHPMCHHRQWLLFFVLNANFFLLSCCIVLLDDTYRHAHSGLFVTLFLCLLLNEELIWFLLLFVFLSSRRRVPTH